MDADSLCGRFDKYLSYCRIIKNDDEQLEEHNSVHKVRLNQQQPSHVSLDECLKLFTKEERVSVFFSPPENDLRMRATGLSLTCVTVLCP